MMLADMGFPRMPSRVLMTMMSAEETSLTAGDLAERLGVSAAAISGAVRYLMQMGFVVREPAPGSRRDRYRLPDQPWYGVTTAKRGFYGQFSDEADVVIEPRAARRRWPASAWPTCATSSASWRTRSAARCSAGRSSGRPAPDPPGRARGAGLIARLARRCEGRPRYARAPGESDDSGAARRRGVSPGGATFRRARRESGVFTRAAGRRSGRGGESLAGRSVRSVPATRSAVARRRPRTPSPGADDAARSGDATGAPPPARRRHRRDQTSLDLRRCPAVARRARMPPATLAESRCRDRYETATF